MKTLPHDIAFGVLMLQAADEGRGPILFGESWERARQETLPFLVGEDFPSIYLEHPLIGEPFLDVTLLFGAMEPGVRVDSPAAGEHGAMLDLLAQACRDHDDICCGFELDTKQVPLPEAAVHFQPRRHEELVRPFCESVGEPERADLYLELGKRMLEDWPLSFFGMFRGRANAPLRACGYLGADALSACSADPAQLAAVFDKIGFSAYDSAMLEQVSALMAIAPGTVDFQLDVYPDGSLGSTFAIDVQFGIEQPAAVRESFENGIGMQVMSMLQGWGVADDRWRIAAQSAFARAIPVERDNGSIDKFAFTLIPQWVKARWTNGVLQPSKLYHHAHAGLLEEQKAPDA